MKYLSLFSGVGGFELGIDRAVRQLQPELEGQDNSQDHTDKRGMFNSGATCIGYSEIDKYATQIYQQHFPNHKNYGDITKINADELPDFDCLVGGFPCQAFSIAGKRGGFEDTRGTMFFELARILRAKQPRLCVFENVKGLLSHDNGNTFRTIIAALDELGYDCEWQVLNSFFVGGSNRPRIFIFAVLRDYKVDDGKGKEKTFPLPFSGRVS